MTQRTPTVLAAAVAAALLALATPALANTASATLKDASGADIGKATLTQTPNGVLVRAEAKGISEGEHAFHIHQTGTCDGSDGFKSAGGHFALDHQHGFEVDGGPHPGDMPNVKVHADGAFAAEFINTAVSLKQGEPGYLFDEDGSALVIHAKADDYRSQPSGDAGDRIACGVIRAAAK